MVSSGARNKKANIAIHVAAKMILRSQVVFFGLRVGMVFLLVKILIGHFCSSGIYKIFL